MLFSVKRFGCFSRTWGEKAPEEPAMAPVPITFTLDEKGPVRVSVSSSIYSKRDSIASTKRESIASSKRDSIASTNRTSITSTSTEPESMTRSTGRAVSLPNISEEPSKQLEHMAQSLGELSIGRHSYNCANPYSEAAQKNRYSVILQSAAMEDNDWWKNRD